MRYQKFYLYFFNLFFPPKLSSCVVVPCGEVQVPKTLPVWEWGHPCPIPNPPRAESHLDFSPSQAAAPEPSLVLILTLILALILLQHHQELRESGEFGVTLGCRSGALGVSGAVFRDTLPHLGLFSPRWCRSPPSMQDMGAAPNLSTHRLQTIPSFGFTRSRNEDSPFKMWGKSQPSSTHGLDTELMLPAHLGSPCWKW